MPTILVRNISEAAHKALKRQAKLKGTSVSAEMRAMAEGIVVPTPKNAEKGLGTLLQEFGRKYGPLPVVERDKTPMQPVSFD